jgi:hypothetical protein
MAEIERVRLFEAGAVDLRGLAVEYGISRSRAFELMRAGKLAYTRNGTKRLVPRRAIEELLAAGLVIESTRPGGISG